MKITKSRLLEIIREEVELHEKNVEENVLELDEEVMVKLADENQDGEISKSEFKKVVNQDQEEQGLAEIDLEEVEKVKHKGQEYKASAATMKAIRGGGGGAGKVTPAEFKKAVQQAKSWADDPEAVAAAGRIVAKKKAGTMEEEVEEDLLIKKDPKTGKQTVIKPKHKPK
jgi:EF hand